MRTRLKNHRRNQHHPPPPPSVRLRQIRIQRPSSPRPSPQPRRAARPVGRVKRQPRGSAGSRPRTRRRSRGCFSKRSFSRCLARAPRDTRGGDPAPWQRYPGAPRTAPRPVRSRPQPRTAAALGGRCGCRGRGCKSARPVWAPPMLPGLPLAPEPQRGDRHISIYKVYI